MEDMRIQRFLKTVHSTKQCKKKIKNIPAPTKITTSGLPLPNVFVVDKAFGLQENVIFTPSEENICLMRKEFLTIICHAQADILNVHSVYSQVNGIFHGPVNVSVGFF